LASECLGSEQCISHCNPDVGWDLDRKGLFGAPPVRVLVGAERHDTVDRAFGLWALTSPTLREALDGIELADSWATDAHNTLNVPYDCGVGIVAQPSVIRLHSGYMQVTSLLWMMFKVIPLRKCQSVLRVSVSNWSTDPDDVALAVDAVRKAASV
jgi:hypothetical protein